MKILLFSFIFSLAAINIGFAQTLSNQVESLLKQAEDSLEAYEFEKALADMDMALKKIESAKSKSPAKLASVYFLKGRIYEEGLYLDKAIDAYTTALKFAPKNAEIYQRRGSVYQYIGEDSKAESDFQMIDNLTKENTVFTTGEGGGIGMGSGVGVSTLKIPEEFQIFNFKEVSGFVEGIQIMDLNNDGKTSQEEIVKPYVLRLSKLHKLVRFNPRSDLALWKRGDHFLQMNEVSNQLFWLSAAADFTNAFEINPRFEYLNNLGVIRAKRDNKANYEFAVKYFTDAIEVNDKSFKPFYNRGLSYLELNEYEKAIADFTEVVKISPNFLSAYKSRARAFRAIGKLAEAEADEKNLK